MKYIKKYEMPQKFELGDYVIAKLNYPLENWQPRKNFVTSNVGKIVDFSKVRDDMFKIKYDVNPNSPENDYITDENQIIVAYKKNFRLAKPEEIEHQKIKDLSNKYNL